MDREILRSWVQIPPGPHLYNSRGGLFAEQVIAEEKGEVTIEDRSREPSNPSEIPAFQRGKRCKICGYPEKDEVDDLAEQTTLN